MKDDDQGGSDQHDDMSDHAKHVWQQLEAEQQRADE